MAHVVRASLLLGLCLQALTAAAYSVTIKDASVTSTAADGDASTEPLTFPRLLPETLLLTPETDVTVAFHLVDSSTGDAVAPQQVRRLIDEPLALLSECPSCSVTGQRAEDSCRWRHGLRDMQCPVNACAHVRSCSNWHGSDDQKIATQLAMAVPGDGARHACGGRRAGLLPGACS